MSLYELDGWWIAFFVGGTLIVSLLMVEAMMQFTSVLLVRPPTRRQRRYLEPAELRSELLQLRGQYYVVEPRGSSGLAARWDVLEGSSAPAGQRVKLTASWKTWMLLDPRRREVRWYESVRTSSVFVGLAGWWPRFTLNWHYQGGYLSGVWSGDAFLVTDEFPPRIVDVRPFSIDTDALRGAFVACVTTSGWTFRPVTMPFYATPGWLTFTDQVVPDALATMSRKRLWGVLYPVSFVLLLLFLIAPSPRLGAQDVALIVLISAAWWGTWGLIALLLSRSARTRQQRRRIS